MNRVHGRAITPKSDGHLAGQLRDLLLNAFRIGTPSVGTPSINLHTPSIKQKASSRLKDLNEFTYFAAPRGYTFEEEGDASVSRSYSRHLTLLVEFTEHTLLTDSSLRPF